MAGFDKYIITKELLEKGWIETEYGLVPPDSLWENRPKSFPVYWAEQLQQLLEKE